MSNTIFGSVVHGGSSASPSGPAATMGPAVLTRVPGILSTERFTTKRRRLAFSNATTSAPVQHSTRPMRAAAVSCRRPALDGVLMSRAPSSLVIPHPSAVFALPTHFRPAPDWMGRLCEVFDVLYVVRATRSHAAALLTRSTCGHRTGARQSCGCCAITGPHLVRHRAFAHCGRARRAASFRRGDALQGADCMHAANSRRTGANADSRRAADAACTE
jgi:hypothetical protein